MSPLEQFHDVMLNHVQESRNLIGYLIDDEIHSEDHVLVRTVLNDAWHKLNDILAAHSEYQEELE